MTENEFDALVSRQHQALALYAQANAEINGLRQTLRKLKKRAAVVLDDIQTFSQALHEHQSSLDCTPSPAPSPSPVPSPFEPGTAFPG